VRPEVEVDSVVPIGQLEGDGALAFRAFAKNGGGQNARATGGSGILPET
jgi:hypothetical protein